MPSPPVAFTIAGFDTSSGAGLQADLLTFHNHGYHTLTAATSLVVETPLEVTAVQAVSEALLVAQVSLLFATYPITTIKIGLLASLAQVDALVPLLRESNCPIVLDPVGTSSTGNRMQEQGTAQAILRKLAPLVTLITPNLPEARQLLGDETSSPQTLARQLSENVGTSVLLKGGHGEDPEQVTDFLASAGQLTSFSSPRITTAASLHGTGCVLSSAIAAALGQGLDLRSAVEKGRGYLLSSLAQHYTIPHREPLLALNHHLTTSHDQ